MRSFLSMGVILMITFCQSSFGAELGPVLTSSTDFNAPIVYQRSQFNNAPAGNIVYDSSSGAFFGLPPNVDPTTASNWLQLGNSASGAAVVSGGSERIERASITTSCTSSPCTIARQSGSWLTSVTRTGTGAYTFTIANGTFTSAPTCAFSTTNFSGSASVGHYLSSATTTTAIYPVFLAGGSNIDVAVDVICMGPK